MSNWENDDELKTNSKFLKFAEGPNKITLASDGDKVRNSYGDAVVEFKTSDGKILAVKPSPMLDILRAAKQKHGTLVGRCLLVNRTGLDKENTKYTNVSVV
jgi:hypothetical protein